MGKGKGARKGMRAFVHVGTFMFRITSIRRGVLFFFLRKLQVRMPFRLGINGDLDRLGFLGKPYV
jgi:ribosomal protein L16/L10AE